jgi:hypothetical protein
MIFADSAHYPIKERNFMKRLVSGIMLTLLLIGTLTLTFAIQTIKAESQGAIKAVVLDSWGTDYYSFTIYPLLNSEWPRYGSIPIVIDYTSLNKESITYDDIAQSEADVLIISHAYPQPEHIFTNSEIAAIKQYAEEGHGIIGTYGTLVPENNRKLAELFGINQSTSYIFYPSDEVSTGVFNILNITHPLFVSLPNPFGVPTASETIYVPSHDWTFEGVTDGTIVALTTDNEAAIIVRTTTYEAIYFTNQMEEYASEMPETSVQVFYNAIVWASARAMGDLNGDLKVDGKDIAIIAKAYGSLIGQPAYVPNADINGDGKIDGKDIEVAAKYYGTHYP